MSSQPGPVSPPRTGPAQPSDLLPGKWVTVLGPNLEAMDLTHLTEDGVLPTDTPLSDATFNFHFTPSPALAHLSGLPLKVAASTLPFVALEVFDVDRTPLNVLVVDTRCHLLCPLDTVYVESFFKACAATRANQMMKITNSVPNHSITDFASALVETPIPHLYEGDDDGDGSLDNAPSPIPEE